MRCQHCYSDIRESVIVIQPFDHLLPTERRPVWLNADNRSPWCLREPCSGNGELHEIKHEPMPTV